MPSLSKGFSLLEILVALAVIGIGMSSALSLTTRTVDNLTEIERKTYAHWLAENQVVELKLLGLAEPGKIEGEKDFAGRVWYWQAELETTFDEDVLEMRVRISLSEEFDDIAAETLAFIQSANGELGQAQTVTQTQAETQTLPETTRP